MTTSGTKNKCRILVVEDNDDFRDSLVTTLQAAGYEIKAAKHGKEGADLITLESFDLVISDVRMPMISGIQLLHHAKQTKPTLQVLLMTGFSEFKDAAEAESLGAAGLLKKPFKRDEVLAVVARLVHRSAEDTLALTKIQDRYCKFTIDDFLTGKECKFDVFIELANARFVKLVHRGDTLDLGRVQAFKDRGVKFLFMRREDFERYVGFNLMLTKAAADNRKVPQAKKLSLVRATGEVLLQQLHFDEMNEEQFEHSKNFVEVSMSVLAGSPDAADLLGLIKEHSDYLFAHSVGVALFSVMIARAIGWSAPQNLFKLSMGALFHDIGKKEISKAVLLKARRELTIEEIDKIETHPTRGMEIMMDMPGIPNDVLQIIGQHHEDFSGAGFPARLRKEKIHPFARLVSVANEFCNFVVKNPDLKEVNLQRALERLELLATSKLDPQFVSALVSLFTAKDKSAA